MARPRTPTKILEAKGAFRQNPQRARGEEPESRLPIGNAPGHLGSRAQRIWKEIVEIAPDGVLTGADRFALELLATLLSEYRRAPSQMPASRIARIQSLLGQFGMTPSDRSKLGVQAPGAGRGGGNAFADL